MVEDSIQNEAKCICRSCPTYPRGADPILYCSRDKSNKQVMKVTCTCPGCPVWHENNLTSLYYCLEGPAED